MQVGTQMKTRLASLSIIMVLALALPAAFAQTAAPPVPQLRTYSFTFWFRGGTPSEFMHSAENLFADVNLKSIDGTNANWTEGWQERLKEAERDLKQTRISWLDIADIAPEAQFARLPNIRFEVQLLVYDGRLDWHATNNGRRETMSLEYQVQDNLKRFIALYNGLAQSKPEIGKLVVEGDLRKPSVVIVGPGSDAAAQRAQLKVRAYPLAAIPVSRWDKLDNDIQNAENFAARQMEEFRGRGFSSDVQSKPFGHISIHHDTKLLIATGTESYVEMVESIVAAYRANQEASPLKSPDEVKSK